MPLEPELELQKRLLVRNAFLENLEDQTDKILSRLLNEYRTSEPNMTKIIGIVGELSHNDSLIRGLDRDIREAEHARSDR